MKTEWNYSALAASYLYRPNYSVEALDKVFEKINFEQRTILRVCDIGAGVAHLTIPLLDRGYIVDAIEPNDEMRKLGKEKTRLYDTVTWFDGIGEKTGRPDSYFHVVTFGSSFNVMDRSLALKEASRILVPGGWFVCMWNHRNLNDPIQNHIEGIINQGIASYDYGFRRQDQTAIIQESGLFKDVSFVEGAVEHLVSKDQWVDAWNSHATLARQAGSKRDEIISSIRAYVNSLESDSLVVPYITRIWFAQKK